MKKSGMFRDGRLAVFLFTLTYICIGSVIFLRGGNIEFFVYTAVMLGVLFFAVYLLRDIEIPVAFLWALSLAGIFHMLGGGIHVNGKRLYRYVFWKLYVDPEDPGFAVFRYDQFVHSFGYGILAAGIHHILWRIYPSADRIARSILSVMAAVGVSAMNEIAEFAASRMLPSTGVGDYSNTMLDFVSNTLGAIIAVVIYEIVISRKNRKRKRS